MAFALGPPLGWFVRLGYARMSGNTSLIQEAYAAWGIFWRKRCDPAKGKTPDTFSCSLGLSPNVGGFFMKC